MAEAVYLPNHLYHAAPSIKKERSVWAFFFYVHNLQNHKKICIIRIVQNLSIIIKIINTNYYYK